MEGDTRKEAGPHRTRAEGHTVVVIGSCANDRVASLAAAAAAAAAEPAADKAGSATSVRRPLHQL
jgi:homoaconitase/3-isopropylmalate dehydratase large subunit